MWKNSSKISKNMKLKSNKNDIYDQADYDKLDAQVKQVDYCLIYIYELLLLIYEYIDRSDERSYKL